MTIVAKEFVIEPQNVQKALSPGQIYWLFHKFKFTQKNTCLCHQWCQVGSWSLSWCLVQESIHYLVQESTHKVLTQSHSLTAMWSSWSSTWPLLRCPTEIRLPWETCLEQWRNPSRSHHLLSYREQLMKAFLKFILNTQFIAENG